MRETERDQNIVMKNRENLSVSGVRDIGRFDDGSCILYTDLGKVTVKGKNLSVKSLSTESEAGEVVIEGNFYSVEYTDSSAKKRETFLGKLSK